MQHTDQGQVAGTVREAEPDVLPSVAKIVTIDGAGARGGAGGAVVARVAVIVLCVTVRVTVELLDATPNCAAAPPPTIANDTDPPQVSMVALPGAIVTGAAGAVPVPGSFVNREMTVRPVASVAVTAIFE